MAFHKTFQNIFIQQVSGIIIRRLSEISLSSA